MLISEMFLLMVLDEEKGKRFFEVYADKHLGLAGAMLMDLYFKGKISIYRKRLRVLDLNTTGDPYLDEILMFLNSSRKARKLTSWINKISRMYKQYYLSFFRRLESHGILTCEIKTKMKIFTVQRFYLARPEVKQSLLEQIKNVIVENMNPNVELACLLSLMKSIGLLKVYILRSYRKQVKMRIDELINSLDYAPETREMMININKAIQDIISGRNAAVIAATAS